MRIGKWSAAASMVCIGIAMSALSAQAADADQRSCIHAEHDVRVALDANANAPQHDAARAEKTAGLLACNGGFYKMGMAHYKAALTLLGAQGGTQARN